MGGGVPVVHLDVDDPHRLGDEPVHVGPCAVLEHLEHELGSVLDQPVAPARLVGLDADLERHRVEEPAAAEPGIGQPLPTALGQAQQEVVERAIITGAADPHPSQHEVDGTEPHFFERGLEQHVVLEAIPAAPAGDHLVGEAVQVEHNGTPGARIEVLEHDRRGVGPVDGGQAGWFVAEADAVEVGGEVEGHVRTLDLDPSPSSVPAVNRGRQPKCPRCPEPGDRKCAGERIRTSTPEGTGT
jgi:hypothetical protein